MALLMVDRHDAPPARADTPLPGAEAAPLSDAQLVVALAGGDQAALAEAYARHGGPCFGLARRLCVDASLAEEVVQEVFLRLWNSPEKFDAERGALRSYLLAQTHGRSIDVIRSEGARRRREARGERLERGVVYDLEREIVALDLSDRVHEALAVLSVDERRAIELAYFGGRTYREVAIELDTPEGTVKSRIRSGLARLRDTFDELGIEEPWTT
jgi:RNA polymerase sigma-70 factor (ECF subfamily)